MIKAIAVFDENGKQLTMSLAEFADLFDVVTRQQKDPVTGNWSERRVIIARTQFTSKDSEGT